MRWGGGVEVDFEGEAGHVEEKQKEFFTDHYLPMLEAEMKDITLTVLEKAQLSENTVPTVTKLLYAFLWQEKTINLGGKPTN